MGPPGGGTMASGRARAEILEDFLELWEKLTHATSDPGCVVVVEGERDRRALRRLGLAAPIVLVHHGTPLGGTAAELLARGRRVIVLTDWDGEGGLIARRLKEFLAAEPLELDLEFRRRFARVLRGEVVHVEGLYGWASRLSAAGGLPLEERLASVRA